MGRWDLEAEYEPCDSQQLKLPVSEWIVATERAMKVRQRNTTEYALHSHNVYYVKLNAMLEARMIQS